MKKSIYDVYVTVTSQEQADRLKGVCLEYGLPIWDTVSGWTYFDEYGFLAFDKRDSEFFVFSGKTSIHEWKYTKITESDFIQLAKEFKQ